MADQEKKTTELVVRTGAAVTDRLVFLSNVASGNNIKTATVTVQNFFANTANLNIKVEELRVVSSLGTPANSTSSNVAAGVIWTDGTYLYFSSANNVVKRVTGSLF